MPLYGKEEISACISMALAFCEIRLIMNLVDMFLSLLCCGNYTFSLLYHGSAVSGISINMSHNLSIHLSLDHVLTQGS